MKNLFSLFTLLCLPVLLSAQINLGSGLVAHFPFNGNAMDASGNGNNGTNNGAILTTGRFGDSTAYYFNGGTNINFGSGASVNNFTGNITVNAWVNPDLTNNRSLNAIVSKWPQLQATDHFGMWIRSNQNPVTAVGHPSYSHTGIVFSPQVANQAWTMMTMVWEVGGTHKIYLNGALAQTINNPTYNVLSASSPSAQLIVGSDISNRWFDGKIDDVRIYDRSLNDAEVLALYTLPNPNPTPVPTLGEWGMIFLGIFVLFFGSLFIKRLT